MSPETIGTHVAAAVLGAWLGVFIISMCRAAGEADRPDGCTLDLYRKGFWADEWKCSECGKTSCTTKAYEHCPRCGAKVTSIVVKDE